MFRIIFKHIVLLCALLLGCITLVGAFGAVTGGQESLAGRAVTLLTKDSWAQMFGENVVFYTLLMSQFVLGVSLVAGTILTYLGVHKKYIITCLVLYILMNIIGDVSWTVYTMTSVIYVIVKYGLFVGVPLYFLKTSRRYGSTDATV